MFETLLVAFDGSAESWRALETGIDLAKRLGSELHAIIVEEDLPAYATAVGVPEYPVTAEVIDAVETQRAAHYARLQDEARQAAGRAGLRLKVTVLAGAEVDTITAFARTLQCGILIFGYHQHSMLYSRLRATTAQALACAAPCSVLAVKACGQTASPQEWQKPQEPALSSELDSDATPSPIPLEALR